MPRPKRTTGSRDCVYLHADVLIGRGCEDLVTCDFEVEEDVFEGGAVPGFGTRALFDEELEPVGA